MKSNKKLTIVLLTGLNDAFISTMVLNFKAIEEVTFSDVIYWKPTRNNIKSIKKNLKKHGMLYLIWRPIKLFQDVCLRIIMDLIFLLIYARKVEEDLFSTCKNQNIKLHSINNLHTNKGIELVKSLQCDLLLVCGTGILRESIFTLPKIGTINLHQGQAPKYRGAPPGFWELWNNEKEVGVTIHFIDKGVDSGDIILQRILPIFEYDNLSTLQAKLAEVSLSLYPAAVNKIAQKNYQRSKQTGEGRQYFFPTLNQQLRLFLKIKKRQLKLAKVLREGAKKLAYLLGLIVIFFRNIILRVQGKACLSVLYYHRVTDICQDGMTTARADFEKQIRFLKKFYNIISADRLTECLLNGSVIKGTRNCLITFDDGYEDNYKNALALLKKYNCPAIFFVSTGFIDSDKKFEHDEQLQPKLSFENMRWEQLQNAVANNIEIGIHSHSHANLGKINYLAAIEEITASIQCYKKNMNKEPLFMSYPFGKKADITEAVKDYIKEHTKLIALFSADGNINFSPINKYEIRRINIGTGDIGISFPFKINGGFSFLGDKK